MTISKTFYVIDGDVFVSSKNESDSEVAAALRDAWSVSNKPGMVSPFHQADIAATFMAMMIGKLRFLGYTPQPDDSEPWPERLTDADLYQAVQEEAGDGAATIYVLDLFDPTYTRDRVPGYPEPLLTVMKKAQGSNLLEAWSCTSLREFVANNIDRHDPDQTILYQIKTGCAQYALVAGDKLERTLEFVQARIDEAKDTPRSAGWTFFEVTDSYPLLRALEDHKRRNEATTLKP